VFDDFNLSFEHMTLFEVGDAAAGIGQPVKGAIGKPVCGREARG